MKINGKEMTDRTKRIWDNFVKLVNKIDKEEKLTVDQICMLRAYVNDFAYEMSVMDAGRKKTYVDQ